MCLQWCHVTSRLIDNDLPCLGCDHFPHRAGPLGESCQSCVHRRQPDDAAPLCGLSKAPLPIIQHCCHWNARIETRPILLLTNADVAPGVLDMWGVSSITTLFAQSESAPAYVPDAAGAVTVALDELAIPLVYGVPAGQWEQVLPPNANYWPVPVPAAEPPPALAAAVVALLDALDPTRNTTDADLLAAHEALYAALEVHPVGELSEPWPTLVAEALALYAELVPCC